MTSPPPELSVVIPLECARSPDPLESVIAWARRQTCDRRRYEVIVASDGSQPDWERRLPEVLTPRDRHVGPLPGVSDGGLIDAGVRAARGKWVHLCELHTVPEPDCAEEILAYLATHDVPGAVANAGTCGGNAVERAEARYYGEVVASRMASPMPPLAARGVTLRADLVAKAGGVPEGYGIFYEKGLEAQLCELGVVLGYAERARFVHLDQETLRGHREDVANFIAGEHAYRRDHGDELCDRHFGRPEVWAERLGYRRPFARARAQTLARAGGRALRTGHPRAAVRALREAVREAGRVLLGARAELAAAWLAAGFAELRFRLARSDDERFRRYLVIKDHVTRLARLRDVGREAREQALTRPSARTSLDMREAGTSELVGLYDLERQGDLEFRWTAPSFVARLGLAPGDWEVRVETGGLRGDLAAAGLAVRFNATSISADALRIEPGCFRFPISHESFVPDGEQRMTISCAPLATPRGSGEGRRLGIPIVRIGFEPR